MNRSGLLLVALTVRRDDGHRRRPNRRFPTRRAGREGIPAGISIIAEGCSGWQRRLALFGPEAASCFKFERDGLRFTLPSGYLPDARPATGLSIPLVARADFGDHQFRAAPGAGPRQGREVSHAVYPGCRRRWAGSQLVEQRRDTIREQCWATAGRGFLLRYAGIPVTQHRQRGNGFPTTTTSGRLRIVRAGSEVFYYVADGPSTEFTLLQKYPFRTDDLNGLQLNGTTGGFEALLDARFTDLVVRADALPDVPEPSSASKRGWWIGTVGLVLAGYIVRTVGLYRRRNRRPGAVRPESTMGVVSASPPSASPVVPSPRVPAPGHDCDCRRHLCRVDLGEPFIRGHRPEGLSVYPAVPAVRQREHERSPGGGVFPHRAIAGGRRRFCQPVPRPVRQRRGWRRSCRSSKPAC